MYRPVLEKIALKLASFNLTPQITVKVAVFQPELTQILIFPVCHFHYSAWFLQMAQPSLYWQEHSHSYLSPLFVCCQHKGAHPVTHRN